MLLRLLLRTAEKYRSVMSLNWHDFLPAKILVLVSLADALMCQLNGLIASVFFCGYAILENSP